MSQNWMSKVQQTFNEVYTLELLHYRYKINNIYSFMITGLIRSKHNIVILTYYILIALTILILFHRDMS